MRLTPALLLALASPGALPALAQDWEGDFQHGTAWYDASAGQLEALAADATSGPDGISFSNGSTLPAPQCFVTTTPYAFGSDQTEGGSIGFIVEYDLSWYGTEFLYNTGSVFDVSLEYHANGQGHRRGSAVAIKARGLHEDRSLINGVMHVSAIGSQLSKAGTLVRFDGEATDIKLQICWLAPWASVTIRRIGLVLSE